MLFKHPSTILVLGPSQSGKSYLVRNIIKKNIFEKELKRIKWCYSIFQSWFLDEHNIVFHQGIPDIFNDVDLIIIDDLMYSLEENISKLFTIGSHHNNISVILILQNIFPKCKFMRDISLNSHYMILFKNNRDSSQIKCLAQQAFPGQVKYFMDAYKKATQKPFSYLLIDFHPMTENIYRLCDSCFPDENNLFWVFTPRE